MKLEWLAIFSTAFQFAVLISGASNNNPVGISDDLRLIPDNQLTSSSIFNSTFHPQFGRLGGPAAWCPRSSDIGPLLSIDLGIVCDICAVAVQGRSGDSIVTNFSLLSSPDGTNFVHHGMFIGMALDGNVVEIHILDPTLTARYILIQPVSSDVCLRVEVYGVPNGVQVQCERSQMVATINRTVYGDDLTLLDGPCAPDPPGINDTEITLKATLGDCGTLLTISKDRSTAFYRNEVTNSTNATFYIICSYERSTVEVSDDGSLEFSMEVFQDKNFTSTLSNNIVPLGQTLYFQVEVDATGFGLNLHLERCWATPTDNSSHEDSFNLINNGCQSSNKYITYFCDNSSNIQRFKLEAFRFSGQSGLQTVYVHCDVTACIETDVNSVCKTNCCTNGTSRRRRRSLEERLEGDFGMQYLVRGPFIIVDRDNNNADDNDYGDDIEEEDPPVYQKESESLSGHFVVIVVISSSIAIVIALIVSLMLLLLVLKGVRGRTVKDVTSDLAVDNMAFDKVDVKTLSMKSK